MCQASANLYRDVSRVKVNVDNNTQLVVGKFVAHRNLHERI
jgi:hypothetical protein